jgi:hypothetical protein
LEFGKKLWWNFKWNLLVTRWLGKPRKTSIYVENDGRRRNSPG